MGRITNELRLQMAKRSIVPIIIEAKLDLTVELAEAVPIVVGATRIKALDKVFISTYATPDIIDQIKAEPKIEAAHFNRQVRQMRLPIFDQIQSRVNFFRERLIRPVSPPFTYRPKEGEIPTGVIRKELGADEAEKEGIDGNGVTVAVIDTGFEATRQLTYTDVATYSVRIEMGGGVDDSGHGTWCINTVAGPPLEISKDAVLKGIATGVNMVSIRTLFTPAGVGNNSDVIEAMRMAVEDFGADVISMSLGSEEPTPEGDPAEQIIKKYTEMGVVFCVAAGNSGLEGTGTINSPGDVEEALTVGSISYMDRERSYYSSQGPTERGLVKPDVVAFGGGRADEDMKPRESIISSSSGVIDMMDKIPNRIASIKGTSMATPEAAGLVALGKQYWKVKRDEMLTTEMIKKMMEEKGEAKNIHTGWGLITYSMIKD